MLAYYYKKNNQDELEKNCTSDMIFAESSEIKKRYPIPAAFDKYILMGVR